MIVMEDLYFRSQLPEEALPQGGDVCDDDYRRDNAQC